MKFTSVALRSFLQAITTRAPIKPRYLAVSYPKPKVLSLKSAKIVVIITGAWCQIHIVN